MGKHIIIFNQRVAGFLMSAGFVLIKIEKSNKDISRNVFVFKDSDQLRKKISEYDSFIARIQNYLYSK